MKPIGQVFLWSTDFICLILLCRWSLIKHLKGLGLCRVLSWEEERPTKGKELPGSIYTVLRAGLLGADPASDSEVMQGPIIIG